MATMSFITTVLALETPWKVRWKATGTLHISTFEHSIHIEVLTRNTYLHHALCHIHVAPAHVL